MGVTHNLPIKLNLDTKIQDFNYQPQLLNLFFSTVENVMPHYTLGTVKCFVAESW